MLQTQPSDIVCSSSGIDVHVAAITAAPDMGEVNEIASDPDSTHVVLVPDVSSVPRAAGQLLDRLCQ